MTTKMRPIRHTIPLAEGRAIVDRTIRPLDRREQVPVRQAHRRVLAADVVAAMDVPPFARAAMDGFAVRATDTSGATREHPRALTRVAQLFTGQVTTVPVGAGECIEISTGAPMPTGADAVVMVEETAPGDAWDLVQVLAPAASGQNIGRKGADIKTGQTLLDAGEWLEPARVGAIAALGITEVDVYAQPRVAILSTGDEIVEPGVALRDGQIYDVNSFTLAAVVSEHGGIPVPLRTASDSLDDLSRAVDECLSCDVIVFSGGSSVGERDLILDVIGARGEVLFHGLSIKPGKPTAFGVIQGIPVFGMPGYPASCLTNAYILMAPALRRIAHLPPAPPRTLSLPLASRIASAWGRHQFYTVRIANGQAVPAFKSSGDITSMSRADGYIEVPADVQAIESGEQVEVVLF